MGKLIELIAHDPDIAYPHRFRKESFSVVINPASIRDVVEVSSTNPIRDKTSGVIIMFSDKRWFYSPVEYSVLKEYISDSVGIISL